MSASRLGLLGRLIDDPIACGMGCFVGPRSVARRTLMPVIFRIEFPIAVEDINVRIGFPFKGGCELHIFRGHGKGEFRIVLLLIRQVDAGGRPTVKFVVVVGNGL